MDEERRKLKEMLAHLGAARMPFGKYGPQHRPPRGVRIINLPLDYLNWFYIKGFPPGNLGEQMKLVWQIKAEGLEHLLRSQPE